MNSKTYIVVVLTFFCCLFVLVAPGFAQTREEATRKLWDTAFINSGRAHGISKRRKSARSYRIATPKIPINGVAADTVVGVTVWRLRRSTTADTGERLIVHE